MSGILKEFYFLKSNPSSLISFCHGWCNT